MPKLIMMRGLPASGKTTRARELMELYGNYVRVNKDSLREMLHTGKWNFKKEKLTGQASDELVKFYLSTLQNVIVDDTNLGKRHADHWRAIADMYEAKFMIEDVTEDIETCLKRDATREKKVGSHVIWQMAFQYGLVPRPRKGYVLCDLDGTLADISHRLPFVKGEGKKDWKAFFDGIAQDKVRTEILDMVMDYESKGYEIILVSARPDDYREATEAWLETVFKGYPAYKTLIMRRAGDHRVDTEVKQEILNTYFPDKSLIHKVIDDRPSVIRMWRENGLDVYDAGEGIEF